MKHLPKCTATVSSCSDSFIAYNSWFIIHHWVIRHLKSSTSYKNKQNPLKKKSVLKATLELQNVHLLSRPLYFPLLFHFLMTDNLADWLFRWGRSRGSHRCCWTPLGGALSSTEWTWHVGSVHWAMQTSLDMGDSELICRSPHTSPCILVMSKNVRRKFWSLLYFCH